MPLRSGLRILPALVLAALLLGACASKKEDKYVERPVAELYNTAMNALEAEDYRIAAQQFDEVERQHPYSTWATKAKLMAAYAHYQLNKYDDAIISLDRFIQLHPSNPDTAYAFYLKGLCYYEQISDVGRDQQMTQLAFDTFKELITRYPNSIYSRDARIKLDLTVDHLAGKEMEIGRYYLLRNQHLAAINRFKTVLAKYDTTTHTPEALHRLSEAYTALGMTEEAQKVAAVLGHNFPGNEWYVDSYQLIEGVQIRTVEEKPWYNFWSQNRTLEEAQVVRQQKKEAAPSWYREFFGGPDTPEPAKTATTSPETSRTGSTTPPASAQKEEPWYKFW